MSSIVTSGSAHDRIGELGDQSQAAATYLAHLLDTFRSEPHAAISGWAGAAAEPVTAALVRFDASAHALIEVVQSATAMLHRFAVALAAQDHSVALALFGG